MKSCVKAQLEEAVLAVLQGRAVPSHPSRVQSMDTFGVWYNMQLPDGGGMSSSQEFRLLPGALNSVHSMNPNHTSALQIMHGILSESERQLRPITDAVLPRWNCGLLGADFSQEAADYIVTRGCMNPKELVNAKRVITACGGKVKITLVAAPLRLQQHTRSVFLSYDHGGQRRFEACSFHARHLDLGDLCSYAARSAVPATHVGVEYSINTGGMCQELDLYSISINGGEMRITIGAAKHLAPSAERCGGDGAIFMPMNQLAPMQALPVPLHDMLPEFDVPGITAQLHSITPAAFDEVKASKMLHGAYRCSLLVPRALAGDCDVAKEIAGSSSISLPVLAKFVKSAHKALKGAMQDAGALAWVSGKLDELADLQQPPPQPRSRGTGGAAVEEAERKVQFMEEMLQGCTWHNPAASHYSVPNSESLSTFVMRGLPTPVAHFKAEQQNVKLFKVLVLYLKGDRDDARVHALEIMQSMAEAQKALNKLRGAQQQQQRARRLQRKFEFLKQGLANGMAADMHPASILRVVLGEDMLAL